MRLKQRRKSGRASVDQLETRARKSSIEAGRVSHRPKSVDMSIRASNLDTLNADADNRVRDIYDQWWANSIQGKDLLAAYNELYFSCAKGGNLPRLIVTRDGEYVLDENGKDYTFHGF